LVYPGNFGRNVLRGFNAAQADISLQRQFRFTEKVGLRFRAEFFNILNHPNFSTPTAGIFDTRGNLTAAVVSQRQINSTVTRPRQIQFALKLVF